MLRKTEFVLTCSGKKKGRWLLTVSCVSWGKNFINVAKKTLATDAIRPNVKISRDPVRGYNKSRTFGAFFFQHECHFNFNIWIQSLVIMSGGVCWIKISMESVWKDRSLRQYDINSCTEKYNQLWKAGK